MRDYSNGSSLVKEVTHQYVKQQNVLRKSTRVASPPHSVNTKQTTSAGGAARYVASV